MSKLPKYLTNKLLLLIFYLLFFQKSESQSDLSYRFDYIEFNSENNKSLLFHFNNNNFFKNNEYFGDIIKGYTLLGYYLTPSVAYYFDSRFRLQAGVNILQYHGLKNELDITPVFSAHLRLFPKFDIIMGTLRGNVMHNMIEPMYDPELQFIKPNESGFQFLYDGNRFRADAWLDWEQFIRHGDTIPEIFTAGISARSVLIDSENGWNLTIPVQFIAKHVGGQIGNRNTPVQTHCNIAAGLDLYKETSGFIKKTGLFCYYLLYKEATSSNFIGFRSGKAIYTGVNMEVNNAFLMLGYWNADNFYAPKGNPIFQSLSHHDNTLIIRQRSLLTGKMGYHRTFNTKLKFSLVAETYYDSYIKQLDYTYMMNIFFVL